MISICDAESHFNNSTNERYHLLIHYEKSEQLKNIRAWKAAVVKVNTKYKKQYQILLSPGKKVVGLTGVFSDKVIDFTNELSMWRCFVKNSYVDDSDI